MRASSNESPLGIETGEIAHPLRLSVDPRDASKKSSSKAFSRSFMVNAFSKSLIVSAGASADSMALSRSALRKTKGWPDKPKLPSAPSVFLIASIRAKRPAEVCSFSMFSSSSSSPNISACAFPNLADWSLIRPTTISARDSDNTDTTSGRLLFVLVSEEEDAIENNEVLRGLFVDDGVITCECCVLGRGARNAALGTVATKTTIRDSRHPMVKFVVDTILFLLFFVFLSKTFETLAIFLVEMLFGIQKITSFLGRNENMNRRSQSSCN
mmetsp:Transcript_18414/g.42285  ORF Transcript_18414/g.42285 Transcript_18414/m.42285 type:complete len:269 (-) Transcript_18414:88-894(-)